MHPPLGNFTKWLNPPLYNLPLYFVVAFEPMNAILKPFRLKVLKKIAYETPLYLPMCADISPNAR